jgi:hypothetical protein
MTCVASIKLLPEAAFFNDNMITLTSSSFLKVAMAFVRRKTLLNKKKKRATS